MPENAIIEGSNATPETEPQGEVNQDVGTTELLFGKEALSEDPEGTTEGEADNQTVDGGEPQGEQGNAPQYYTPEEMRNLSPEGIDTSRIPPEQQAFYKALQANYTRKHMELAEVIKNAQKTPQAQGEPRSLDEAFQRDPVGTLNKFDSTITELTAKASELAETDPFEAVKAQNKVLQLNQIKNEYIQKFEGLKNQHLQVEQMRSHYLNELQKIPDFETKQYALTEFAVTEMGLDPQELAVLVNPQYTGTLAPKIVHAINNAYDKANGIKRGADKKQIKQTPVPLLQPSGVSPHIAHQTPNRKALFSEAQKSNDWTKVLQSMGY